MKHSLSTAGMAGLIAAVAITSAACGGGSSAAGSSTSSASSSASSSSAASSASSSETSSASAAAEDRSALLITAEDVQIPGEVFTRSEPQLNPGGSDGVAASFDNETGTRSIGDSIIVLPDAGAAKTAYDGGVAALGTSIADPAPQPAEVGTGGVIASGASPDGTKDVTVVTFTQGAVYVVMQFDSVAGDPVPADFATALAQKQADNIKTAMG